MDNYTLDNKFELTFPLNLDEAVKLGAFNTEIHGEETLREIVPALYSDYPGEKPEFFPMIVERANRKIISSVMLIPWTYTLCGVEIKTAELGMVGTLPEYRGLGLSNYLTQHFFKLAESEGFDLSHIQGIPGFYRRYGYTYACELQQGITIETSALGQIALNSERVTISEVETVDETAQLFSVFNKKNKADIQSVRSPQIYKKIHAMKSFSPGFNEIFAAHNKEKITGGFAIQHVSFFPEMVDVSEAAATDKETAAAILRKAAELAETRGKQQIRFGITEGPIAQLLLDKGACRNRSYNFYMKVINLRQLLEKMRPLFERRLAAGSFKEYTGLFTVGCYGEKAFVFRIEAGKIAEIAETAEAEEYNIQLSRSELPHLLLGTDSIDGLKEKYTDFWTGNLWYQTNNQQLSETLFPKLSNSIRQVY